MILGFALGAAVVDSQQQQDYAESRLNDPAWIAYCARRHRSFDPTPALTLARTACVTIAAEARCEPSVPAAIARSIRVSFLTAPPCSNAQVSHNVV